MTEPQHGPEEGAEAVPAKKAAPKKAPAKAAKKAPAKKAPAKAAKKAPAKKAPAKAAKKAPAKTAVKKAVKKALPPAPPRPPQLALEPGHEAPALEAAPTHAALNPGTSGTPTAKPATAPPRSPEGGRARLPLSIGLAALGLVAVVLSRFRRG